MGIMYVRTRISKRLGGASRTLSLLVDTGAITSVVPRAVLQALGVKPLRKETFELADGRRIEREVGAAFFTLRGLAAPALVVFGEPGDSPILGVTALEQLGLEIDPRTRRLKRSKLLLASAAKAAPSVASPL